MPGLTGFTKKMVTIADPAAVLITMRETLVHTHRHHADQHFDNEDICASHVHVQAIQPHRQPCSADGTVVWLDGEFYNRDSFNSTAATDDALLLDMFQRNELVPFLRRIDGYFAAVIYDCTTKSVTLITDRYGLRHLYIHCSPTGCAWSSEIKALCRLPSRSTTISRDAVNTFLTYGHFTGNRTWFDDITLLAPATILTVDCTTGTSTTKAYWHWSDIVPQSGSIDVTETARELGLRFRRSVERRCRKGGTIGLGLSGGLDSRAIFAAIPVACEPIPAATFGTADSLDMRIARRVAKLRPSRHLELELTTDNWLDNRIEAVWWTDGQMNILDMHGVEQLDLLRQNFDVDLNGFLGDALLGGSYGSRDNHELERYADRGRRFIALGLVLSNNALVTRMPFFDNDLMELTMSIPLRYRRNSFIYNRMLLETFPEYYRDIPWQKTGLPISATGPCAKMKIFAGKCAGRIAAALPIRMPQRGYADYGTWIRQPPAYQLFTGLLEAENARLYEFVDRKIVNNNLQRHLSGSNQHEMLGRYLTLELWLRRLFQ